MTIDTLSFVGKVYADVEDAIKKEAAGTTVSVQNTDGFNTFPPQGAIVVSVDKNDVILNIIDPRV